MFDYDYTVAIAATALNIIDAERGEDILDFFTDVVEVCPGWFNAEQLAECLDDEDGRNPEIGVLECLEELVIEACFALLEQDMTLVRKIDLGNDLSPRDTGFTELEFLCAAAQQEDPRAMRAYSSLLRGDEAPEGQRYALAA